MSPLCGCSSEFRRDNYLKCVDRMLWFNPVSLALFLLALVVESVFDLFDCIFYTCCIAHNEEAVMRRCYCSRKRICTRKVESGIIRVKELGCRGLFRGLMTGVLKFLYYPLILIEKIINLLIFFFWRLFGSPGNWPDSGPEIGDICLRTAFWCWWPFRDREEWDG